MHELRASEARLTADLESANKRVRLLEELLGRETALLCAWAKDPAKYEPMLREWARVLDEKVPEGSPPPPERAAETCAQCGGRRYVLNALDEPERCEKCPPSPNEGKVKP